MRLTVFSCVLAGCTPLAGCAYLREYQPAPEPVYAPVWEPRLALHEKAARYERELREHHVTAEGLIDYAKPRAGRTGEPRYGWHADGPFFTGIALGTFSLKYAATRERAVLADVDRALAGLEMLEAVTGESGLFARYFSKDPRPAATESARHNRLRSVPSSASETASAAAPAAPAAPDRPADPLLASLPAARRAAPPLDDYIFRGDVSKDQYAGALFGLGACLAHVDEPRLRRRAAALARRVSNRLERAGEEIRERGGALTTHGSLRVRYGPVRIGLHAAICLGFARAASEDGWGDTYFRALLDRGYADAIGGGVLNVSVLGVRNHVNDNMVFLALYGLFQLDRDEGRGREYRRGLERLWRDVGHELNPFFNLVYVACGGRERERAIRDARESLRLFPDEKRELPVDWTGRPELGRRCLNSRKGKPRAERPLPMNMRPIGTMQWVRDPDVLVGNEGTRDERRLAALDYLEAYWLGRAAGTIRPEQ